jgi:hypothetical protein
MSTKLLHCTPSYPISTTSTSHWYQIPSANTGLF